MCPTTLNQIIAFLDTLPEPRIVMNRDYKIIGANRAYLSHYHVGEKPRADDSLEPHHRGWRSILQISQHTRAMVTRDN